MMELRAQRARWNTGRRKYANYCARVR